MRIAVFALLLAAASASAANLAETQRLIARIKAVSKEGAGNQEAGAAWKELVTLGGDAIVPTLAAMDDASPAAANWLRSAVNAIAEKEKSAGRKLPADNLEAFLKDTKNLPAARRLAYEVLVDIDPKTPERLLPGMLHDPSTELRRDAVAAALTKAEKLNGDAAKAEYARLFAAVRDEDQAKTIAEHARQARRQARPQVPFRHRHAVDARRPVRRDQGNGLRQGLRAGEESRPVGHLQGQGRRRGEVGAAHGRGRSEAGKERQG